MKNIKFFNGQEVEAEDLNNAQSFKADEIKQTRLDIRSAGIIESESSSVRVAIDSDNMIDIYGFAAYDPYGNRIVVPTNENPVLPYISRLLPDENGKLIKDYGTAPLPQTYWTLVVRVATQMEGPLRRHVTTSNTYLITEADTYEFYLRARGAQIEGDVVLCNIDCDEYGKLIVDESVAEYSFIKSDEVATSLESSSTVSSSDANYSGNISFTKHINAVGTGEVTSKNPHGLSPADIGIDIGELANHQALMHADGIRSDNILSTTSAMYPSYRRETATNYEVVYIQRLDSSLREVAVVNGKLVSPSDFASNYSFSFKTYAADEFIGYYLFSYDVNSSQIVVNGPFASETSQGFISALNTSTLFPVCSLLFSKVQYDVTGDGIPDVGVAESAYDIIPGSFKDRRVFNNISIDQIRPDQIFALSQFAPYCNDRAYLHNARIVSALSNPDYYVADKQLSLTVNNDVENPIVITFLGSNPLSAANVVEQIQAAVAKTNTNNDTYLMVYPRITSGGQISLSAATHIEINPLDSNDASALLGFTSADNNMSDRSDIIKELIYTGDRNGIVLFTYDPSGLVTYIEYLLGGGVRRYNQFNYDGDLIINVKSGVESL